MRMVSEVMTHDVRFVSPQESLQRAAQMMDELDVGALHNAGVGGKDLTGSGERPPI